MITIKKVLLGSLLCASIPTARADFVDEVSFYSTVALCAAGVYATGRIYHSMLHNGATNRYQVECDIVEQHAYLPGAEHEIIGYILQKHEHTMRLYSFFGNKYRNYPILYYKNTLDWYINRLWVLQVFHLGTQTFHQVGQTIEQLEHIRAIIEKDYRFIQERRLFEESRRQNAVHVGYR